jgi:hypothetical protein
MLVLVNGSIHVHDLGRVFGHVHARVLALTVQRDMFIERNMGMEIDINIAVLSFFYAEVRTFRYLVSPVSEWKN